MSDSASRVTVEDLAIHLGWARRLALSLTNERIGDLVERCVPSPEVVAARAQLLRQMAEHFLALPEPYLQVLSLRCYEGLDATAIGLALGVPPGTVRWRVELGLEQLRSNLDRDHQGDRKRWMVVLLPQSAGKAPRPSRRQPWWMRAAVLATAAAAASVGFGTVAW